MLVTAFLIGMIGSFHCIGMCGPIALALPQTGSNTFGRVTGRVLYNSGRIITYMIIGLVFGFIGHGFSMAGLQQFISIGAGVLIILIVLIPAHVSQRFYLLRPAYTFVHWLKGAFGVLFRQRSAFSIFAIGFFNGFLPCGLVYVAVAGAMATGRVEQSVAYMGVFGLGTFPVMLAVSLAGNFIGVNFRRKINKWIPAFMIVLAFLFILRGMNLGIPYVSPAIQNSVGVDQTVICH